jgi:DNA modification methylase
MINLYKGDCLELMKDIPDGSIDAIITDPPYGTTACKWDSVIDFELMWEQLNRIIKPNGAIVLFGSEPFSSALRMSNIKNYKYDWIWVKDQGTGHLNAKKQPLRNTELVHIFYKKQCMYNPQKTTGHKPINKSRKKTYETKNTTYRKFKDIGGRGGALDRYPITTLFFNRVNGNSGKNKVAHPTQKPILLMEYLIRTYTNENETVLDFTMGSGSTGVACVNTNRNFIGIEMDDNYFKIAEQRIKDQQRKNEEELFRNL